MMSGGTKWLTRMGTALFAMCAIAAIGAAFSIPGANIAFAQEQVTNTPPELRDFKLEPEAPKPEPVPRPAPDGGQDDIPAAAADSPAAEESTPATPPARLPESGPEVTVPLPEAGPAENRLPQQNRPALSGSPQRLPSSSSAEPENQAAVPEPQGSTVTTSPADSDGARSASNSKVIAPQSETANDSINSASFPYWQIALILALGGLSLWWFFHMLRGKREAVARAERGLISAPDAPAPLPKNETAKVQEPADEAAGKAVENTESSDVPLPDFLKTRAEKSAGRRPQLEASFTPLKATISLANLTIKGQLEITNTGNAIARKVGLNTDIISANADQESQIAAFHSAADGDPEPLGDIARGEQVRIDIDLILPLRELQTFQMEQRKLFAPIVLANIAYGWGAKGGRDDLHLSYMIGREANPPTPKMAPLRLDLGPRSISPLGHRSLLPH